MVTLKYLNNYKFDWTPDHYTPEYLETLRLESDDDADTIISIIQEWIQINKITETDTLTCIHLFLSTTIPTHKDFNTVKRIITEMGTIPSYVSWPQIERAQHFFMRVKYKYINT